VPGRLQSMAELLYEFVAGVLQENAGKKGMQYFPFVFTLFMFILIANLLGMLPIAFTTTSHIVVTFALAMLVFVIVNVIGFMRHGLHFFSLIVPGGVPWYMLILLVPIELLSYLTRPISLSVRLFANMLAGHTMLKVFAGFVIGLGLLGGWAPLVFLVGFTGLELVVAFLQAFIFTVLTCIYLNDAVNMHH
jgi:F-type H+-transporting ATPase subunit a